MYPSLTHYSLRYSEGTPLFLVAMIAGCEKFEPWNWAGWQVNQVRAHFRHAYLAFVRRNSRTKTQPREKTKTKRLGRLTKAKTYIGGRQAVT